MGILFLQMLNRKSSYLTIRTYKTHIVRVRFAPSPTGFLHLGGLRTALYNYFFARKLNGKFILRIEDTDRQRLIEGAIEQLQYDLKWTGINVDEGPNVQGDFGPYIQSERLNIYKRHVDGLLADGLAYHCFCTDKRLELVRKHALKLRQVPKYDNKCRYLQKNEVKSRLDNGQISCIRFKLTPGSINFNDLVYGAINYNVPQNEGDPIIMKSDGFPTYHLANVVDDHCMRITHVLRGVEWQISTPKHLLLYKAFKWSPPEYAHLPLLLNLDGSKLSKRQGDVRITQYRDCGIFPLSLINFIVHSGGGFEKDSIQHEKPKSYTLEELIHQFHISRVNSHSGKLMPERLLEFNRLELKRKLKNEKEENEMIEQIQKMLKEVSSNKSLNVSSQAETEYIRNVLHWSVNRITKLSDLFTEQFIFIWILPSTNIDIEQTTSIKNFLSQFLKQESTNKNELNVFIKNFCNQNNLIYQNFVKLLRSVLSGLKKGPSVAEMMEILGKEGTINRLKLCLQSVNR